jgi:hypothetical protein
MEHLLNWDLLSRRLLPTCVAVLLALTAGAQAGAQQASPQQNRLEMRAEIVKLNAPRKDVDEAAPDEPVSVQVEFAANATIENVAELVFAQQVAALSVFTKEYSSSKTYVSNGHSFSYLGPPREEQLARARCQGKAPYGPHSEPGDDGPLQAGARTTYMNASVVLPAAQARRWVENPPDIVSSAKMTQVLSREEADLTQQVMTNVLTMQLPVVGIVEMPPGCDKYMYIQR